MFMIMKKGFGSSLMLFLIILFFVSFAFIGEAIPSLSSGLGREKDKEETTMSVKSMDIKRRGFLGGEEGRRAGGGNGVVNLEDYRPIDPVPSSKASIRPGPIQHGTPLMPYIPKPSPPPADFSMQPTFFP